MQKHYETELKGAMGRVDQEAAQKMRHALEAIANDCRSLLNGDDFSGMSDRELFGAFLATIEEAIGVTTD